jgi:hypothetical protein
MLASELVKQLQDLIDKHGGDRDVIDEDVCDVMGVTISQDDLEKEQCRHAWPTEPEEDDECAFECGTAYGDDLDYKAPIIITIAID